MSFKFIARYFKLLPGVVTHASSKIVLRRRWFGLFSFMALCFLATLNAQAANALGLSDQTTTRELGRQLEVGDVVFIRVTALPFKKVASATASWTNHVGIVTDVSGSEPTISESTFPISKKTPLSRFVKRSEGGRVAVGRLSTPLTSPQQAAVVRSAQKRLGVFYDTGFNLESKGQFCSRYVREVLEDATGIKVGEVEDFSTLLTHNPKVDLAFWQAWFFGNIPWQRKTVTPASLLESPYLQRVFDGNAKTDSDAMRQSL